jgi:trimethylamine--corrinoid protein Co-methyltransferase
MLPETITELHNATIKLLNQTGVYIGSDRALDIFVKHSVRVDRMGKRVFPNERNIEKALASAPQTFHLYGRNEERPLLFDGSKIYFLSGGASLRVLDLSNNYVAATMENLHQFNILLDALPHVHILVNQVDPHEIHGKNLYPLLASEMLIGTSKPLCLQASTARDVKLMFKMGSVVRESGKALVEKPLFFIGLNAEPPMAISADISDALMACCETAVPCSLGNYNMMGITAPRTVPGAVVQLNAVQLTAIILVQTCKPGHPIFYTAFSGNGNMRTLEPITSDPLSVQQQRLAVLLGRSYRLPVYSFAGTDSRMPDAQAACEHALQFQIAMDSGCNLLQGPTSMMDQMMLSSFAQAIIDHDIISYILECRNTPACDPDTMAINAIHDVLTDPDLKDMKFSAHPHTVGHINEGMWNPLVFSYDNYANWQKDGKKSIVQRANQKASHIINNYRPESLHPEQIERIRALSEKHTT